MLHERSEPATSVNMTQRSHQLLSSRQGLEVLDESENFVNRRRAGLSEASSSQRQWMHANARLSSSTIFMNMRVARLMRSARSRTVMRFVMTTQPTVPSSRLQFLLTNDQAPRPEFFFEPDTKICRDSVEAE